MWRATWLWLKANRSVEPARPDDRADMGVEIGLDASIDSMLPPLLDFAAPRGAAAISMPLGTDQRSHPHPNE